MPTLSLASSLTNLLSRLTSAHAVVVQPLSHVQPFTASWTAAHQAPLSFTVPQHLLRGMHVHSTLNILTWGS